jgi:mono/diheme cytochrome c family protein
MKNRSIRWWLGGITALLALVLIAVVYLLLTRPGVVTPVGQADAQPGWFAQAQLQPGEEVYAQHCAHCHGQDLQGQPPLLGTAFLETWDNQTLLALFEYTRRSMPLDRPGSLDAQAYADVTAYVLHANGFPAGTAALQPTQQERMRALILDASVAEGAPGVAAAEDEAQEDAPEDAEAPAEDAGAADAETEDGDAAEDAGAADTGDTEAADTDAAEATAGYYTAEQAERGGESYAQHCASCHGEDLQGNPPLVGDDFLARWDTVAELYDYNRTHMPQDDPGSLDDDTYADITAFILQQNDLPEGEEELPADEGELENMSLNGEPSEENGEEAEDTEATEGAEEEPAEDADVADAEDVNEADTQEEAPAEDADAAEAGDAEGEEAADAQEEAEADGPPAHLGWLELQVDPANVTVNVIGPEGYTERLTGAQTLRDLPPGRYLVAASRGHQSAMASAQVEAGATASLSLVLDELSRSEDVPEEPAVPAAEVPAIAREPVPSTVGEEPDAEAETEEAQEDEAADEADETGPDAAEEADTEADDAEADTDAETEAAEEEAAEDGEEGYYTAEQAERGHDAYSQHCASCHGDDLQGNPPLVGDDFLARWDTVADLFDYNRTQMPQDAPGSLDDDTYADITAYILQQNALPEGEEELPADENALQDMPLNGEGEAAPDGEENGELDTGENGEEAEDTEATEEAEEEPAEDAEQESETEQEAADTDRSQPDATDRSQPDATDRSQAERGAELYAQHCARCHGETLSGNVAPALAGPVFFERWGGHPVDWLHFQAKTSMPPHSPGTLDDQDYTDIIVYALAENGLLEGHEQFRANDPELLGFIIVREGEEPEGLQQRIERLREAVHAPFAPEPEASEDPILHDEAPVRPGAPEQPELPEPDAPEGAEAREGDEAAGAVEAGDADEGADAPEGDEPEDEGQ